MAESTRLPCDHHPQNSRFWKWWMPIFAKITFIANQHLALKHSVLVTVVVVVPSIKIQRMKRTTNNHQRLHTLPSTIRTPLLLWSGGRWRVVGGVGVAPIKVASSSSSIIIIVIAEGPYSNYKPRTNCLPLQADTKRSAAKREWQGVMGCDRGRV